jgi:hypothetical protein
LIDLVELRRGAREGHLRFPSLASLSSLCTTARHTRAWRFRLRASRTGLGTHRRAIADNTAMAPVDGEELQAVLAKDITTEVALDPEGSESYRSRK